MKMEVRDFQEPVNLVNGGTARIKLCEFRIGDTSCDECHLTIYTVELRWVVTSSEGQKTRYHLDCYTPICSK